jgi:hypothetical protein
MAKSGSIFPVGLCSSSHANRRDGGLCHDCSGEPELSRFLLGARMGDSVLYHLLCERNEL